MRLTKWCSAIHPIGTEKEALADGRSLENHTPLLHDILLLRNRVVPFSLVDVCAGPQRHLVVLSS